MKKISQILSSLTAVLIALCAFTACSSDDDTPEDKPKGNEITIAVNYEPNEDLLLVSDITFTYSDGVNPSVSVPVTGKLEKTFKITKFPCTATYRIELTPKSNIEKKESYNLISSGSVNITNNGKPVTAQKLGLRSMGIKDIDGLIQKDHLKNYGGNGTWKFDKNAELELN